MMTDIVRWDTSAPVGVHASNEEITLHNGKHLYMSLFDDSSAIGYDGPIRYILTISSEDDSYEVTPVHSTVYPNTDNKITVNVSGYDGDDNTFDLIVRF